MAKPHIVWFRRDLRLSDNPALWHTAQTGAPIVAVFIHPHLAEEHTRQRSALALWNSHVLDDLATQLDDRLWIISGEPYTALRDIAKKTGAEHIHFNRCYEPEWIAHDQKLLPRLREAGLTVEHYPGNLIWEPWQIKNQSGEPYKVFSAYFRQAQRDGPAPREPLKTPEFDLVSPEHSYQQDALQQRHGKSWETEILSDWDVSENGAHALLSTFIQERLKGYGKGRDFPADNRVSRLSPYLASGLISPRQVWHALEQSIAANVHAKDARKAQSEIAWREFAYHSLYHFAELPKANIRTQFDRFPWHSDDAALQRWKKGLTGFPIVDAGMRELWQTGYMHNRIRMVTASFLVKNLMIDWREGAEWFLYTLVDADLASNSMNWQWVAGSGIDAAPYFRIFNPTTQAEKFDPDGDYIRRFVPELKDLPDRYIHQPAKAPRQVLDDAGIVLGDTYPEPIVDLKTTRQRALDAYQEIRS